MTEVPESNREVPGSNSAIELLAGLALITLSGENLAGLFTGLLLAGDGLSGGHVAEYLKEQFAYLKHNLTSK